MRITDHDRDIIRRTAHQLFGSDAKVKLFGSRVDDQQRGGDIDLLIELAQAQPDSHKKSLTLAAHLQIQLGDQPIDIVVVDPTTPLQPIHREAIATGIPI